MFYRIKLEYPRIKHTKSSNKIYIYNLVGLIFQKRFNSRHFFAKRDMYYMCDIHFNLIL